MKSVLIVASVHHGNTRKIAEALAKEFDIEIVDAAAVKEKDLSGYDRIGFASGQFFSKFHPSVLRFAQENLPLNKKVFLITTYGGRASWRSIEDVVKEKQGTVIGRFGCRGYDTFGPFKLVGGIAKGHPNAADIARALAFYRKLADR